MTMENSGRSLRRRAGAVLLAVALLAPLAVATAAHAQSSPAPAPALAPARIVQGAVQPRLVDAAARIEALLAGGQTDSALAAARQFLRLVTERAGFGVGNARLTVAPAEGFGMFEPRPDSIYAIGEPVFAYVEISGFTLTPQPAGFNRMLFDVSFTLDSPDGHQMTDAMIPMGEVRIDSHSDVLDAYIHLTYSVSGAEGPFMLRTEVVDRASGEVAEFVLPVEFRAEAPGSERK